MKRDVQRMNFLDFVPRRTVKSIPGQDGRSILLVPKFGTGRAGRLASSLLRERSVLKIHLDELGTRTWEAIDGSRTICDIAGMLRGASFDHDSDVHERCARFMRMLHDARAICLEEPGGPSAGNRC